MLHYDIEVTGRVQGVFYRHLAKKKAEELDIKGFVRNEKGGSVFIEAEGKNENLEKFTDWCRKGPDLANVENIKINQRELKKYKSFEIKND